MSLLSRELSPASRFSSTVGPSAILRGAVSFVLIPAILGALIFYAIGTASDLAPQQIRLPGPETHDPYLDDFVVFRAAGELASDGAGRDIYSVSAIHEAEADVLGVSAENTLVLPFFNPPPVALALAPLAAFSVPVAAVLWTAGGLAILAASLTVLLWPARERLRLVPLAIAGLVLVTSMPFQQAVVHGQMTFMLFGAFTALWFGTYAAERRGWAMVGWLTLAIKPQLLLLPLIDAIRCRRWGLLASVATASAALVAVSASVLGWRVLVDYPLLLLQATSWQEENGISTFGMFGWNAFARALLGEGHQIPQMVLSLTLTIGTLAGAALAAHRLGGTSTSRRFAVLVFAALLVSPHLYAHDVLLAGVAGVVLWANASSEFERLVWLAYGAMGWIVLHVHFDILAQSSVNLGVLWLALGLVLAALPTLRHLPRVRSAKPLGPGALL